MKKIRNQKGITLIALMITIVVLIILAGVAIKNIMSTNLIDQASTSGQKWNEAQKNESTTLGQYEADLGELVPISFTIDGVKYTAKRGTKWWSWNDVEGANWECTRGMVVTEFISEGYDIVGGRRVKGVSSSDIIEDGKAYVTEEFQS